MKEFLHNLFIGDWPLKVFSLGLAVLTWLAVSFSLRQKPMDVGKTDLADRSFFDLPVSIVAGDADVRGFNVKPSEVNVTLRGASNIIANLKRQHVRIQVDLTGTKTSPGTKRPVEVITPPGVAALVIEPNRLEIIPPPVSETEKEAP